MTAASVKAWKAARASSVQPSGRSPSSTLAPSGDQSSGEEDAISLPFWRETVLLPPADASKIRSRYCPSSTAK